jgi:hypothetical protein
MRENKETLITIINQSINQTYVGTNTNKYNLETNIFTG